METTEKSSLMEKYLTPVAVLVGALIIAGAFIFGHAGKPTDNTQGQQPTANVDIKNVKTDGDPFIGNANAPVTIAFWFDYQCPFCKQFEENTMPQVYDQYIKTGKVKVVLKDFQFLGNDSTTGAEFARAMWDAYPDKFYDWYKAMFAAQDQEGDQGFGNLDSIKALTAKMPGVDVNKVVALMNQKKAQYDAAIEADRSEGQSMGVNGTPAMIIGTKLLSGAQPFTALQPLIEGELTK